MNSVLLGIGIGMLSLIAPGPINLTLIQVGARRGRRHAVQGAIGVVGAEILIGAVAVLLLSLGSAMPEGAFAMARGAAAVVLIGIGVLLALKPTLAVTPIDRMQRPARAFFLLTSLTPTALAGWVAMLAAMPFASDTYQLGMFTAGVIIASLVWHPALGMAASAIGARLSDKGQRALSRAAGLGMGAVGLALLLAQI